MKPGVKEQLVYAITEIPFAGSRAKSQSQELESWGGEPPDHLEQNAVSNCPRSCQLCTLYVTATILNHLGSHVSTPEAEICDLGGGEGEGGSTLSVVRSNDVVLAWNRRECFFSDGESVSIRFGGTTYLGKCRKSDRWMGSCVGDFGQTYEWDGSSKGRSTDD
jgi:hypothetical protein